MGLDLQALGAVELADPEGSTHRMADVWRDQPTIVVFLRHFG
ncbi:MAG TPA: hypothetical protein VMX12_01640 [Acidimicrobiia bacterium]|nr:hypothetical protein [Acidimicrobiia bacterium]